MMTHVHTPPIGLPSLWFKKLTYGIVQLMNTYFLSGHLSLYLFDKYLA